MRAYLPIDKFYAFDICQHNAFQKKKNFCTQNIYPIEYISFGLFGLSSFFFLYCKMASRGKNVANYLKPI